MSFILVLFGICSLFNLSLAGLWVKEKRSYDKVCNVLDYGAKGDGVTNDTDSIISAMNDCYGDESKTGQVVLPSGYTFLTSALNIVSQNTNCGFYISQDTTLLVSDDRSKWPGTLNVLQIQNQRNFIVEGGGTFDGQGKIWWEDTNDFRPEMMYTHNVDGLIIKDILVQNCPNHCLEIFADHTEIYNIEIINPPSNNNSENATIISHNTDGIDVHGKPFYIHDSYISTGDDNVAIHDNDTLIENCVFGFGHGTSIGSLSGGYFTNITVNNCTYKYTNNGVKIKTDPGSSHGRVWNIKYTNLNLVSISEETILITQYYGNDVNETSYLFIDSIVYENITSIQNSTREDTRYAISIMCQPSTPCTNITMNNVQITAPNDEFECSYAQVYSDNTKPPVKSCYDNKKQEFFQQKKRRN